MSMLLKYTGGNVTPPDKFKFTCPHCGYKPDPQFALEPLKAMVLQHYKDNEHPMPDDLSAYVEDQMCQLLPPGWCVYSDGTAPTWHVNYRMSPEIVMNGTRTLLELARQAIAHKWFGADSPLVSKELAASRAQTCSRCQFNATLEGCASCSGIANMVAEIAGKITTPSDPYLRQCIICGCSGLAQTRLTVELLNHSVNNDTMEHFPRWCWKKSEILEFREKTSALTNEANASTTSD